MAVREGTTGLLLRPTVARHAAFLLEPIRGCHTARTFTDACDPAESGARATFAETPAHWFSARQINSGSVSAYSVNVT